VRAMWFPYVLDCSARAFGGGSNLTFKNKRTMNLVQECIVISGIEL